MKNLETDNRAPKPAPKAAPMAGGFFMALGMLGGGAIGIFLGESSAGMIIGLSAGNVIALLIWFRDRRNSGDV